MTGSSKVELSRTAFLGTGLMGRPMAGHIAAAGFPLSVWNRHADKARPLETLGVQVAATPAEAASGAAVVCLCLTDAAAVEAVVFGPDGAAQAMTASSILVDFSTVSPADTRRMAAALAERTGARWVDAPVSGGVAGAEAASLIVLCGGTPADVDALQPLWRAVGRRATRLGDVGAGQAAKLCNQLIVTLNVLAIAEAVALARANGLDVAALPAALEGGFADSAPLRIFGPRMAAEVSDPMLCAVSTMAKDLASAVRSAQAQGLTLPLAEAGDGLYRLAQEAGLGPEDLTVLAALTGAR